MPSTRTCPLTNSRWNNWRVTSYRARLCRNELRRDFIANSMQALGNNPRKEEFRIKGIVDRLETTGRVWLGTTLGCAECHDHKYDPVSTQDYYELFAIFNNVPHLGEKFDVHGPRLTVSTSRHGNITAQVMAELPQPRQTHILVRGEFQNRGERVGPDVPRALAHEITEPIPDRLKFARWLVDRRHPLTARVFVNRIWQHYFGQGLVRTADDFGLRGALPSHPELLDWLAVEFMESGWSPKHVHRLILNSATLQQEARLSTDLKERDSDNVWLARFPRRRASAEVIRDMLLTISGQLSDEIGGPSVYPFKPPGVDQFKDDTAGEWKLDNPPQRFRRGIYVYWQRTSPYPSMILLDATSRERCTVKRTITNTPLQALALLNDPVVVDTAQALAKRVTTQAATTLGRIDMLYQLALGRAPRTTEIDASKAFLESTNATQDAWSKLALVMLNLDEVLSIE